MTERKRRQENERSSGDTTEIASEIVDAIAERLAGNEASLREQWRLGSPVPHIVIDDLLPPELAREIATALPTASNLSARSSIRERKKVGIELEQYSPTVGDALLAFQDSRVIEAIGNIVDCDALNPDPTLYASGLSVMAKGDFLHPHIDNSHDGDQALYRVINLLFYVSPGWRLENGGNLELWGNNDPHPHTIVSSFNRLVVMATTAQSWHSVSRVTADRARWCVSNYYFSPRPLAGADYSHVTTFRGRPGETLRGPLLWLDGLARNALGRAFPFLLKRSWHRRPRHSKTEADSNKGHD